MANRRWTVMLVPHGSDGSKALSLSGTVVKLAAGIATVVAASMLAATIGVSVIPYQELEREKVKLPDRQKPHGYVEPKNRRYNFVPEKY